jgi:hypothetical protein
LRYRILAVVAVAVLAYFAAQQRALLPAALNPSALITGMRNQSSPLRFTLSTDPEPPSYDEPIHLRVHVTDNTNQPADGLILESNLSMNGMSYGAQSVSLRGVGNGNYLGTVNLEMPGSWYVDLIATKHGEQHRERFNIEVSSTSSQLGEADDAQ